MKRQDYIIATNTAYTIKDLCAIAFAHVDLDWQAHVETDPQLERPNEIAAARGNYARAKAELGWEPRTDFTELVKLMVEADLSRLSVS